LYLWHQFPAAFVDDKKQDAGGQIYFGLAVVVRPAFEPGQVTPDAVVQAFDGEGVRFALDMVLAAEDFRAGMSEVGGKLDPGGVRQLRSQPLGRFGSTIPQRPAQDRFGSTINSPPEPAIVFFLAI
jgi:hypothetical protein